MLRDALTTVLGIGAFLGAMAACLLPRRYWPRLDAVLPIGSAHLVSALAVMLAALILGGRAYMAFADAEASAAIDTLLQATGWRPVAPGAPTPSVAAGTASWVATFMSFFTFSLATPAGVCFNYLALSSLVRVLAALSDDPRGDPVLSLADGLARGTWRWTREHHRASARHRLEGDDVPDIAVRGADAGCPDADLVIVASRRKAGWDPGVTVLTPGGMYRLGTPRDRRTPHGLRTLYPLTIEHDNIVLRRWVRYEVPSVRPARWRD